MVFELEKLRKLLAEAPSFEATSIVRFVDREESEETPTENSDAEPGTGLFDYDPSELCSRKDFVLKLGVSHDELFCQLVEANGGTLPQKEFATYANLSSSTISRLLQEMEDDGQVVRVPVGREKVVCLPEYAPQNQLSATDDGDDTLRV
ncbi:hypothetical protein HUG10_06355 [Halorarum halophilum]|uniref:DUF7343 domain-containing protein n=1 Tax=Halorarum halophilum TaxID=2743090 RepID=A0A7D5GB92_9EURY|nr:hypothetical protein [Halobaculum halophilum]QLG27185.1 hypothetical protein HUG10_06355 [Halobaculum halophilum]